MKSSSTAVALTPCSNYKLHILTDALDRILREVELPLNLRSSKVLLKPNLISAKAGHLPCTEGALILAVARWLIDCGAQVSVGDSPAFGSATMVLNALGLTDELANLGVRVQNFNRATTVHLPGGGRAMLAQAAMESDLLVNLPRVKAHVQARLTLAVKNFFGCLVGLRKAWWHMAYGSTNDKGDGAVEFSDRLVRIPAALPNSLSIVDGIIAMHKSGPINGAPYPLSLLAASTDPVAADRALHEILLVNPLRSPLMSACQRAGMVGATLSQLSFPLSTPQELQVTDFQIPEELKPIRFNPFRFLTKRANSILRLKNN
ncbi:MAG: DUF362 domain-containing protein [Candidatus Electrothrix sp. AR4]|nr:DUF362 domain-containing protein [Candidatus Electrothrix sp. AR4]